MRYSIKYLSLLLLALIAFNSCDKSSKRGRDKSYNSKLVINEVMASNQTGLLAENDSLYDWIEIKNISKEAIRLEDYVLTTNKADKEKKKKNKKNSDKKEKKEKNYTWKMPAMELAPGDVALIFASGRDCNEIGKELHTNFKISTKDVNLQILTEDGDTVSAINCGRLEDDMCYRRLDDGSYDKSYRQSPGLENTDDGYEKYNEIIEKQRKSPLRIWEAHTKKNKFGNNTWVEIKNISDSPVDLQDYGLTGETYKDEPMMLPKKQLAPGEISEIDCKEELIDIKSSKSVALVKGGQFMDGLCGKLAPYGMTVGRAEGENGFFFYPTPTRGQENFGNHYRFIAEDPKFSLKPGVYREKEKLVLQLNAEGRSIHYTTDGSTPTESSPLFKDSIIIDATTVIRAFCDGDSTSMRSNVATATYFINVEHTLPIVNICIRDDELFNPTTGIYMPGPGGGGEYPHYDANYWQRVTKTANMEFYDTNGESFSTGCGFAIFGGFSRTLSKKSFKVKFRDVYGIDQLHYDIFNEGKDGKYKNLVLRSGSQDMQGVMVRDEFFTSLMKENSPSLLIQNYRPVALYINGQYFGLYYIREKIDKHFAAKYLDIPSDSMNIIMSNVYNEEGPKDHFQQLVNFVKNNDMKNAGVYEKMSSFVDLNGLIDQKLGEIYSGNLDVGNIRYIRSTHKKSDKKWYFVYYDIDISWREFKSPQFYLRQNGIAAEAGVSFHNLFVDKLLDNPNFRKLFLERLSLHMHKTFSPENTTKVYDSLIEQIKLEMKLNCKRWPNLLSFDNWEKHVAEFREKFKTRHKEMLNALREELKITPEENKQYFGDLGY